MAAYENKTCGKNGEAKRETDMTITYTQEDCMKGMARYPDKYFDLAIVDHSMFGIIYAR